MKIQFASDLHLEFYDNISRGERFFEVLLHSNLQADVLVLAGDIGYPESPILLKFLKWCSECWKHVIWVYGNHEYYNKKPHPKWRYIQHLSMPEKEEIGKAFEEAIPNLHVLHNETLVLPEFPDYIFVGSTLWTDVQPSQTAMLEYSMADFSYIEQKDSMPFTTQEWMRRHTESRAFIEETLETPSKKAIIITHHLPSYDMILDKYKNSDCNYGFAAHCDSLLKNPSVVAWICGHSHGSKKHDTLPCYLNARGYPREDSQSTYSPHKLIEF